MENLWIFYSLAWLIALWLGDFIKKIILKKWADKEVFLFICFIFYFLFLGLNLVLKWAYSIDWKLIKDALVMWVFDSAIPLWMLTTLKYLDISFALVTLRVISSIVILIIGIFVLWDTLSILNILWFIIWIIAIILLSGFQFNKKHNLHKKWITALIVTMIAIIGSHSYFKYIVEWTHIDTFMLVKFFVSFICVVIYMSIRKKFKNFSISQCKICFPYAAISWVLFSAHFLYFLPNIYLLWPLSLWYKILSYSLIVPIILSIILYKDPIDTKRIIAFVLTLISLALFII